MSHQATFTAVVGHFLTMTHPATVPGPEIGGALKCVYRAPDGGKCFAGALIPDRMYIQAMENNNAIQEKVASVLGNLGHDCRFVHTLQQIHDKNSLQHRQHWRMYCARDLIDLAIHCNLAYSPALDLIAVDNSALLPKKNSAYRPDLKRWDTRIPMRATVDNPFKDIPFEPLLAPTKELA